jgi:hypothetical protein
MPHQDNEKAKKILKERDLARKGIEPGATTDGESPDPIEAEAEKERRIASNTLAIGLGLKRSG